MNKVGSVAAAVWVSLWATAPAYAFDLTDLQRQLGAVPVLHGAFVQERTIPSLRAPLVTRGSFVLWDKHGLLWRQTDPAAPPLRITTTGIASLVDTTWRASGRAPGWLTTLFSGDLAHLAKDFTVVLTGDAAAWHLDLTPRGGVMAQVVAGIQAEGGAVVHQVSVTNQNGQSTRLSFSSVDVATPLTTDEQAALAP